MLIIIKLLLSVNFFFPLFVSQKLRGGRGGEKREGGCAVMNAIFKTYCAEETTRLLIGSDKLRSDRQALETWIP